MLTDNAFVFAPYGLDRFEWNKTITPQRVHWNLTDKLGRAVLKNNPWQLKSYMGLARLDSTSPHVSAEWEERRKDMFKFLYLVPQTKTMRKNQ